MGQGNNKIIYIVIISTFFGLASGIIGSMVSRVYVLEKAFNIPLMGYSYLDGDKTGNLVIQGARKIVIEQNAKVDETISSAGQVITGIFEKKADNADTNNLSGYYQKNNEIGQGFIVTSDGWMMSEFTPQELKIKNANADAIKKIAGKYVVITKQNEIYEVNDIIYDPFSGYSFWRMNGNGFPVRKFINESDLRSGQMVIAVNWDGHSWLTNIVGVSRNNGPIYNSDKIESKILLAEKPDSLFNNSFVFDLNGGLAGIINSQGEIKTGSNYLPCLNCLLNNKELKYPSLGINYLDMSRLVDPNQKKANRGALIYKNNNGIAVQKNSPAESAGLMEGDLILSVNNIELNSNNDLGRIIAQYAPGDMVSISFERGGEINNINVALGERLE